MPGSNDPTLDFYNSLISDDIKKAASQPPQAAAVPARQGAGGEHQARKLYQGRASYDFIKNGVFQTDGFAVLVNTHSIAECEDSEVADWICKQWNVQTPEPVARQDAVPETSLLADAVDLLERLRDDIDPDSTDTLHEIESIQFRYEAIQPLQAKEK